MRFNIKGLVLGCSIGVLLTITLLWSQCNPDHSLYSESTKQLMSLRNDCRFQNGKISSNGHKNDNGKFENERTVEMGKINCIINQKLTVSCRQDGIDVYLPFSFIHDYFEVYGRLSMKKKDGEQEFEWSHSYSTPFIPKKKYDPLGSFINFHFSNVEARARVKCISAIEGVPVSIQWKSPGHLYPIQIAQFGLSHFSKHLEGPRAERYIIEDGVKAKAKWRLASQMYTRVFDEHINSYVLKFNTLDHSNKKGVRTELPFRVSKEKMILNMFLSFKPDFNSSVVASVRTSDRSSDVFFLHYVMMSDQFVHVQGLHIFYGLGFEWDKKWLTRNIMVDVLKGVSASSHENRLRKRINKSKIRLLSLEFHGNGEVSNISLSTNEHIRHFYDSADWFVRHQDDEGGWPTPIARKIVSGVIELEPGWYSAMAQGHAISLLVRAAHLSGNEKYIKAAVRATNLFKNVSDGGVRTYFAGRFAWYEEYPTIPSLFVLNGFIFSLLGLYDLKQYFNAPENPSSVLFEEGMKSLRTMLPLFDTGQGSFYDLRHFSAHVSPNIARWDYHTTHIAQLLTLASIDQEDSDFLEQTAFRWKDYLVGKRAKHN